MAREVRTFSVTVPAGTPQATPQTTSLTMPSRIVTEVRVRTPPGPRGEVGYRLALAGVQLIPYNSGAWLITDDQEVAAQLDQAPDSGAWQMVAYNTGQYAHTLWVTFLTNLPGTAQQTGALPLSGAAVY